MSDIVERLEACLDIPEVPSSVCRAISEAADLIISLRAIVATPKPEAEPVGYVTKNEFTQLRLGASCVDLFGKVVPTGFEMVPLYAHPPKPEATEGGAHEADKLREENRRLLAIEKAAQRLAYVVRKSVNAGPVSNDPTAEGQAWRALRLALGESYDEKGALA